MVLDSAQVQGSVETLCAEHISCCRTQFICGYLLLSGLAFAAASSSARKARVFSRNAIFCFRSLLKRAVSPQVFDI